MIVYQSPAHRAHAPEQQFDGAGHVLEPYPEVPERIDAILRALGGLGSGVEVRQAPPCDDAELASVHDGGMLEFLSSIYGDYREATGRTGPVVPDTMNLGRGGPARGPAPDASPRRRPASPLGRLGYYGFDAQTPITAGTWDAARGAAACGLAAARAVASGRRVGYAACRPPGHHAGPDFYGGYGFLNNAALAARALRAAGGRVAVLDVDYHHGNGTQEVFYREPLVQYVSLHADPDWAYPYFWGRADERGAGAGEGSTRNFPLRSGTEEPAYLEALEEAGRTVAAFGPDFLVVSLGVDTFEADPVGDFRLPRDAFARIGERIGRLRVATAVVQEGGYSVDAIGACVLRFFEGLLGSL